ncbi:uncharacterized protein C8A04DRAFT_12609 [Dichotomopilus funicola]|uniref:Myb-like domain-containing protein n=1 Tax=Dichotomopilus funicola TaxID=1934379 RepID=A0AAN6V333_9PEZI|nr:hypothetical protein C8A04DRAFT_12609 [Dichotomopilus funicola]
MTRSRHAPRRSSRDISSNQRLGNSSSGPQLPSLGTQTGGYRLIAAQQPSTDPRVESLRYPPPPPPPPPLLPPLPLAAPPLPTTDNTAPRVPIPAHIETASPTAGREHREGATSEKQIQHPDLVGDESAALAEYPYSIYNHGTWTADDDKRLIQARSQGQNWADLKEAHFPTKSANACRKRYERLVERRGIHDYTGRRLESVSNEYMNMRREIWSGLADRVGMKWDTVEALCMNAGLRTIQSNARSYTNRARRDSRISQKTREAQAEVMSVGQGALPMPGLPVGSEFGTAFTGHGVDLDRAPGPGVVTVPMSVPGSVDRSMPPPPFIPSSGPHSGTRLPPMALPPQAPYHQGYPNGNVRPLSGLSHVGAPAPEPPPVARAQNW